MKIFLESANIDYHLHIVILATVAAGFCGVSLVAGISRYHWSYRTGVIVTLLLGLLPIRAYEPLVLFVPLCGLLSLFSYFVRGNEITCSSTSPRLTLARRQISLSAFLLAVTLLCGGLAILLRLPWRIMDLTFGGFVFDFLLLLSLSCTIWCVVESRASRGWIMGLVSLIAGAILIEALWGDAYPMPSQNFEASASNESAAHLELCLCFVSLLAGGLVIYRYFPPIDQQAFRTLRRALVIRLLILALIVPAIALY